MSKTSQRRILVAVTGSRKPYVYDLPRLLAMPPQSVFRFRYRPQWVHREVYESDATPQPMLIVYWSHDQGRLVPLRWSRLRGLRKLGAFVHCEFVLGPFVGDVGAALAG